MEIIWPVIFCVVLVAGAFGVWVQAANNNENANTTAKLVNNLRFIDILLYVDD